MVDVVNTGLDLSNKTQAKCGSKIVSAAAQKCQALLTAESIYQKGRTKAGAAEKRAAAIAKAEQKFTAAFTKAKTATCPTAATVTARKRRSTRSPRASSATRWPRRGG
jgi:hypothetical protein